MTYLIRSKKSADQSEILLSAGSQRCEAEQSDTIFIVKLVETRAQTVQPLSSDPDTRSSS